MHKTFTAGENLVLVDGEIYLTEVIGAKETKDGTYPIINGNHIVLASTKQLEGIKQLDRSLFVKPVDVEELAFNEVCRKKYGMARESIKLVPAYMKREIELWKEGYNANKAEFTKDDLAAAILFGVNLVKYGEGITEEILDMEYEGFINELRPLTLPKQITTDHEYNVIEVLWK